MVFPVVVYGCESWTIKEAEHRRIDAFELWCWRRLLRVPWTARRSNQSILHAAWHARKQQKNKNKTNKSTLTLFKKKKKKRKRFVSVH